MKSLGAGQLSEFRFGDVRVPLTDRGRGIRKPAQLSAALSFSTVYTPPAQRPPYEDVEGVDERLRGPVFGLT